jgi:hypothetical protein
MRLPWMSRRDRALWRAADTVGQLGTAGALWLGGGIASQPGYAPRYGPDTETLPLVEVLAAVNRAGFYTTCSQPGLEKTGMDGDWWQQKAAVTGFVTAGRDLRDMIDAAEEAGLDIVLTDCWDADNGHTHPGIVCTTRDGEPYTQFGATLTRSDIEFLWSGFPAAVTALQHAPQITFADPHFGPSTRLWDVLATIAGQSTTTDAPSR